MKVLCVAEKPSIAKSITQILSGGRWDTRDSRHKYIRNYDFSYNLPAPLGGRGFSDFTVTAVLGHLTSRDFGDDHRKWHACDPFALFDAPITTFVDTSHKAVETNLIQEARNADLLMIWTDCDREGEHIGAEVMAACRKGNRGITVKRARFSAIIPAQIHQACRQADELDMRMADAVEARMSLDLRLGAAFTRLTTLTLQGRVAELAEQIISYGPCQFPTLGFVVDQYNRVQAFVPETFWYIYVAIERESEDGDGEMHKVEFKWKRNHLFDMEVAVVLYEQCVNNPLATVLSVETKPTQKWKPLPLTTVELQQSGSRLLHMSPARVLDIAEKLYQRGILSYPRTETDQYDNAFDFTSLIQKQTFDNDWGGFAQRLLDGEYVRPRNGKKNDKAHPPIHPTAHAGNLEHDERRVFELITRRFLASCSSNAEGKSTTVEVEIANEYFSTSGLVVTRRNYLDVYPYDKWASSAVPDFQEGEQFMPSICEIKEGSTTKPNLLTEADLVGLMDKNGIGTDATIAEHISKIIDREYVVAKQEQKVKYLVPSALGVGLAEGFDAVGFDRSLIKPHLRRETEHRMQLICDGVQRKQDVLDFTIDQYKEVFLKLRREFGTVIDNVVSYLHGDGEAQAALRAAVRGRGGARGAARGARGTRGGRGGRGGGAGPARGGRANADDDDESDDDDGDPRGGGAGAVRGRGRGRGSRGTTASRGASTRGRGRGGAAGTASTAPRRKRGGDDFDDDGGGGDSRNCNCGGAAVQRSAGPSSANPGRKFWTCPKPKDEQCGFFEWDDAAAGGGGGGAYNAQAGPSRPRAAPEPAKRARTASSKADHMDAHGVMRCDCDLEATLVSVNKDGPNKGRQFWKCPNNPRAQCGLFVWDDDGDGGAVDFDNARPGVGSRANGRGQGTGPSGGSSDECYKCHQTGHWASQCPNEQGGSASTSSRGRGRGRGASKGTTRGKGRGGAGAGGGRDECYKCHETGHWASACPNDGGGRR